jgi:hypothetical protein
MRKLFSANNTLFTIFVAGICLLFVFTQPASARVSEQIEQLYVKAIQGMWPNNTVPASGTPGFEPGAEFYLKDATLGKAYKWVNQGTKASCLFVPVGPVAGYGFVVGGGPQTSAGGDTTEIITLSGQIVGTDVSFVEHSTTNDTDTIVAQIATNDKITITGSADPSTAHAYVYAAARNKCEPQWDIFAAGTRTAIAGDTTSVPITVTGVLATDIAFATIIDTDDTDTLAAVACTTDTVTLTVSADPVTDHTWSYVVLRPRGTFKPSHYIAYAGVHTTVADGSAPYTAAITVTGALATDIPIVHWNTTDDTDTIVKAVMSANTLTVTLSADPGTTHKLAYMILRAY